MSVKDDILESKERVSKFARSSVGARIASLIHDIDGVKDELQEKTHGPAVWSLQEKLAQAKRELRRFLEDEGYM